ncbi:MAG TPA: FAD-dependent oxidoreductase [Candidatus Limnocylindria bacterium]|nr:FAD-dependent oxidoreductase [Candidatus Limnocylindria bacterium]
MISENAIPLRFQTAEVGVDWLQCNIECQEGCPVNTNCRGYLMLAAEGRFEEGYILARDPNPVAAICGYVCSAPCEKACRRADIDKPLAIRAMKRFLVDWHYANNMPDQIEVEPPTGRSVAVIGAGPAGLTVAKELAGSGHEVHVYDALPSGGGTTLIGVPAFRLPRDVIELDVNWVAKHGVEFHYNVEVGRDVTLDQLRERHDAVVVAAGCMYPVAMNIPGEELDGVVYGVDFLKRANLGQEQWVGDHVVIVGGGYTAMDSSRTALRLGAKTSVITYRRGPDEMVVDEEEQHETRFEGVRFELFSAPVEVLGDDGGKVTGVRFQRTRLGPPDASGRRSAEAVPGSDFEIACDMVIPCTSQASDNNVLGEYGSKLNRHLGVTDTRSVVEGGSTSSWRRPPLNGTTPVAPDGRRYNALSFEIQRGYVVTNPDTFATNVDGVFACGDFVTGPATIIEAAGRGRRTARAVDRWLAGVRGVELEELPVINRATITQALEHDMPDKYDEIPRQHIPMAPPELRRDFTSLVEVGYDTRSAVAEGARCLQCNHNINIDGPRCILCGLCADVCPEGVIYMIDKAQVGGDDPEIELFQSWPRGIAMIIDEERCIRCNLCVERCPTNCITMDRLELERFTPDGKVLLESYKDNVLGQAGQQAGMAVSR